jgi:hypothetical protein
VQVGEPGGGVEPRRQLRDRQRRQPDRGGVADRGGGGDRRDQRHAGGADLPHQQARVDHAEVEPQGREVARPRADRQHRRGRLPQRRELGVARRHLRWIGELGPAQRDPARGQRRQRRQRRGVGAVEEARVGDDHRLIAHHLQHRDRLRRDQLVAVGIAQRRGHRPHASRGRRVGAHRRAEVAGLAGADVVAVDVERHLQLDRRAGLEPRDQLDVAADRGDPIVAALEARPGLLALGQPQRERALG